MTDAALDYLRNRGITDAAVLERARCELADGRCWLPWLNDADEEIYRTGRAINGQEPKYKHSPGPKPPLFASPGAWEAPTVALVEGQIDALLCAQAGIPAFATSGAQIAETARARIAEILGRKQLVILVADDDSAGRDWRAQLVDLLGRKVPLLEARLPQGLNDLGDVATDALGSFADPADAVFTILDAAMPALEPHIFVDWEAFWAKDRREPEWLHDDVLARARGHSIYASHKAGKSLLMLWVVLQIVRAGTDVIYLDYEMTEDDLCERLEEMGVGPETDLSRLHYALLPSLPPLDTADGAGELLARVDLVRAMADGGHAAVIVDTTSRATAGEENSADTIRAFYRWTGLGLKQRGITWARLDHAGKDSEKGQRGSSAKGDDVDIVWKLDRTENGLMLVREASRMGWVPEKAVFVQQDEPLRFVKVAEDWPEKTKECAERLDALGIAVDVGAHTAGPLLRDSGFKVKTQVIVAAQRYRKERAEVEF